MFIKKHIAKILIGVILLATIAAASQAIKSFQTEKFYGLNIQNELQLKPGEFTDMENFRITEDNKMSKRDGYTTFFISQDEPFTNPYLPGEEMTYVEFYVQNKNQYIKLKSDTKEYLYAYGYSDFISEPSGDIDGYYWFAIVKVDLQTNKAVEQIYPMKVTQKMIPNWLLFIKSEVMYISINTPHAYYPPILDNPAQEIQFNVMLVWDGSTVEVNEATIPTLYKACKPDRSDWSSKAYQPLNILTNYRKIDYLADGTTDYYLEYWWGWEIDTITVNGVETTDYTKIAEDVVRFDVAPSAGLTVIITYSKTGSELANPSLIYNCTNSIFFGGAKDMDLFVWGNPDHPNTIYNTYAGDVTYFADTGFRTAGDETITDVVVQNTTQIIFGENRIFYTEVSTTEDALNPIAYGIKPLVMSKGHKKWTPNTNVQIVNNNPVFISPDGTINELVIISERDERNVRYLSKRDMSALLRSTSTVTRSILSTFDNEPKKEYMIFYSEVENEETTYKALVYNYYNDTWYKYSGLKECTCPILIDNKLYMFGSDYSYFDSSLTYDLIDGVKTPIYAYAESPFTAFGKDFMYKSIQKLYITLATNTENDSYVKVRYWTNKDNRYEEVTHFVSKGSTPIVNPLSISARRFVYFKIMFISDTFDACTLINHTQILQYGGMVR